MKPLGALLLLVACLATLTWSASCQPVIAPSAPAPTLVRTVAVTTDSNPQEEENLRRVLEEQRIRERLEAVDDLPVPIVPGTRVTEAESRPPRRLKPAARPSPKSADPALPPHTRAISGRLSATEERALHDARLQLEREVADWVIPDVPLLVEASSGSDGDPSPLANRLPYRWRVPRDLIDRMIRETHVKPVVRDYGTVYEATLLAEFSPERRDEIVAAYQHDLVAHRLTVLAGIIAFILACLAALASYIRADEATKGYYTQWLRAGAAAGVGASGVVIYRLLA